MLVARGVIVETGVHFSPFQVPESGRAVRERGRVTGDNGALALSRAGRQISV